MKLKWRLLRVGGCRQIERLAATNGCWAEVEFPALCSLMEHPRKGRLLFDTGYGSDGANRGLLYDIYSRALNVQAGSEDRLSRQLEKAGVHPSSVGTVFLSHFHPDHIGGLDDVPQAKVLCARSAYDSFRSSSAVKRLREMNFSQLIDGFEKRSFHFIEDRPRVDLDDTPLVEFGSGFDLFQDRSLIAIPLAGHAPGHFGLYFHGDDDREVLLLGDSCWTSSALEGEAGPPWPARFFFHDNPGYDVTLQKLRRLRRSAWKRYGVGR
jgi:glyoxylase-like metal-dependent hydrolase (beta-lactamase superfamily II)